MALGDIAVGLRGSGVGLEITFADGQGVEGVELGDAEAVGEVVGHPVADVVEGVFDIVLD